MKYTLLEIVQEILSDIDSDEVNSIDDTIEAEQVATIVKSTYLAMMSNRNWPHLKQPVQLEGSGQLALPTHMKVKDNVKELIFVNYNVAKDLETRRKFKTLRWLEPEEFLRRQNGLNNDADNVDVIQDPSGIELMIRNDLPPSVYTSFDDEVLVFDAYDQEAGETLISSKVQAQAHLMPTWTHTDSHIPDLPEEAFIALIEESKSRASFKLNQMLDQKAEQEAGRQQRWLSRKAWKVKGGIKYAKYGRRGSKGRTGVAATTFEQGKQ